MAEEFSTPDRVHEYLAEALRTDRRFLIVECRFGWVCRPVLSEAEVEQGRGLGMGNYVVNRASGVVTAHRSLPPALIGEEYDRAAAAGEPVPGYRVYPPVP